MSLRGKLALVFAVWLGVFSNLGARGQSQTSGRMLGNVRDPLGHAIPRAKILCVATATGESRTSETDDSGDFIVIALLPGTYDLTISSSGFATSAFHALTIGVGETTTLSIVLQIARNVTQITVNEAPPLIRTDSSELGITLTSATLDALPLASRNALQLISVTPGANTALTNNSALGRNSPQVSVNGARVTQNSFQINGVDANNISMHDLGDVAVPASESIAEIRVQSSLYDASVSGA